MKTSNYRPVLIVGVTCLVFFGCGRDGSTSSALEYQETQKSSGDTSGKVPGKSEPPPIKESAVAHSQDEEALADLINAHRLANGLSGLIFDGRISEVVRSHSSDMANSKVSFSHDGFGDRIKKSRSFIPKSAGGAENIAAAPTSGSRSNAVFDMWLKSPAHKLNMEGKFLYAGIGISCLKKMCFATLILLK